MREGVEAWPCRPSFQAATTAFVDVNRREAVDEANSSGSEVRRRLVGQPSVGWSPLPSHTGATGSGSSPHGRRPDRKSRAMKRNDASPPLVIEGGPDPDLDDENQEFDFSNADRPGRNDLFERAQGHFHEVTDAEDQGRSAARSDSGGTRYEGDGR